MLLLDFSWWYSTLLRDLSIWSAEILNLSTLSTLLNLYSLNFSFSGLSVLFLDFSLRSVLFLGASKKSTLLLGSSMRSVLFLWSVLFLELILREGDFSTVDMNLLRCLRYSGYSSKLQWLPPFSHRGSYFSWHSTQSCLPCEQSTTSSAVP